MNSLLPAPRVTRYELVVVVASTAGVFALFSAIWWYRRAADASVPMTTGRLAAVLALEAAMAAVWVPRLRARGWSHRSLSLSPEPRDVLRGVSVFLLAMIAYTAVWTAASLVSPQVVAAALAVQITGQPALWIVILVAAINPIAEEFLYLGFIARALEGTSVQLALAGCTAVRVGVHLYQGPLAIIAILPFGLVFGAYYLRTHRIWPVIVAHSVMDAMGLLRLEGAA
jgi:uncharacterized protein